ncbi:MAG: ABC transporter ATP-binding protein [Paludibacterium sp.]|uniref:ABC transporter ATP-binding protein n=1 Tax=Paludibacterium sp. TaxID=1917523 RepID=UPI0025FC3B3F|nr:ABC transporter ATP-binding protein [Paludibacterium sp.]MBV8048504.1 ABC transporter ATP-binding protein [Paludibacterium sp.]MBV8647364.1 ABC transporter ATP-binding protein [Paludibacterium sp.]
MLEVDKVSKRYERQWLAHELSLTVGAGEIVALLGPSGCGKSTLLKMIAGLEPLDAGAIRFAGVDLARVPPEARHFALMFQDFALFPHLNVLDNVCFGLVERRMPKPAAREAARAILATVGLAGYDTRAVGTLSGGEAQRVALARALVTSPRLLLLDEPFSSLDAHLRLTLQAEFGQRIRAQGISALLVTHDRQEAFAMADRIALLHQGRIRQCDTPAGLLAAPADAWVARFIGFDNVCERWALPETALRLSASAPAARVETMTPLAEGMRLQLSQDGQTYILHLSAREASPWRAQLAPGASVGLAVDSTAFIDFV